MKLLTTVTGVKVCLRVMGTDVIRSLQETRVMRPLQETGVMQSLKEMGMTEALRETEVYLVQGTNHQRGHEREVDHPHLHSSPHHLLYSLLAFYVFLHTKSTIKFHEMTSKPLIILFIAYVYKG